MTKKITFKLAAELVDNATSALLLGDFNNWDVNSGSVMKPQKDGSLKTSIELELGKTYQYRFLLNNGTWVNDENAAEFVPEYMVTNCVITIPEATKVKKVATKKESTTTKPTSKVKKATKEKSLVTKSEAIKVETELKPKKAKTVAKK